MKLSCCAAIRGPGPGNARNRACPEPKCRIARPAGAAARPRSGACPMSRCRSWWRPSGAVVSAVLPVDSAEAIRAVLDPVLSKDALLVTDGGTALACCAIGMKVSHEVMNQSAGERVRGELHIQTVNSLHERIKTFLRVRRGGHQIPRQLPAMVPSRRSSTLRHPALASMPPLDRNSRWPYRPNAN